MASVLNHITIADIKSWAIAHNNKLIKIYKDSIVIANKAQNLDIFHDPCRIDGVVLFLCTKGDIHCSIDLKKYHITPGNLLVNFTSAITQVDDVEGVEAYAMLVSNDLLNLLHIDFNRRQSVYIGTRKDAIISVEQADLEAIVKLFELIEYSFDIKREETDEIVYALLQSLARIVVSVLMNNYKETDSLPQHQPARAEQIFEHFVALVTQHHCEERGVIFYADKMCLTANYLSSVVKKVSGKSAMEWVNDFVISEAKILLRYRDISIQEIAYKLHFPTQSAFGKYFKQCTGLSPRAFRNAQG